MSPENEQWKFKGFFSPNTTQVPDEFIDVVAPHLSGAEVKVMLYVIRRTYGFKKQCDNIAISQMLNGIIKRNGERLDYGTGLSKPTLLRAIKTLTEKNILIPTRQFDFKGGNIATNYQLNVRPMKGEGASLETLGKKMIQGGLSQKLTKASEQNLTKGLVKKRDTQHTVIQHTVTNNVNVTNEKKKGRNILHRLIDAQKEKGHIAVIAEDILTAFGDKQSEKFYLLVARKVPEHIIRRTISELKDGRVASPARVFTSRMMLYAEERDSVKNTAQVGAETKAIAKRFSAG